MSLRDLRTPNRQSVVVTRANTNLSAEREGAFDERDLDYVGLYRLINARLQQHAATFSACARVYVRECVCENSMRVHARCRHRRRRRRLDSTRLGRCDRDGESALRIADYARRCNGERKKRRR